MPDFAACRGLAWSLDGVSRDRVGWWHDGMHRADRSREQGRQEHTATLPSQVSWPDSWMIFSSAVIWLIRTDRPSEVARFLGRGTAQDVRDWRRGACGIPSWALALVKVRLEALGAGIERDHDRLSLVKPAPGQGSHRNICKWNQRRYAAKSSETS